MDFGLGLGWHFQPFLKWNDPKHVPVILCYIRMQITALSIDSYKIKASRALENTEDVLHPVVSNSQPRLLHMKINKLNHIISAQICFCL